jgi:hypothetical protein
VVLRRLVITSFQRIYKIRLKPHGFIYQGRIGHLCRGDAGVYKGTIGEPFLWAGTYIKEESGNLYAGNGIHKKNQGTFELAHLSIREGSGIFVGRPLIII